MAANAGISSRACPNSGFTLLELAVVVVIIGIITAIGLPAYQRIQRNTRFGALINDYRVLTSAFQQYSAVNAAWPAYAGATGDFPQGMEPYLRSTNWDQPTVFGGHYNWDRDVTHNGRVVKAAIAIYPAAGRPLTMTTAEMLVFDQRYDDGDLGTGYFQQGFGGSPVYIIEDDSAATPAGPAPVVAEATPDILENLPDAGEEADVKKAKKEKKEKDKKDEEESDEKDARQKKEKAEKEEKEKDKGDKK